MDDARARQMRQRGEEEGEGGWTGENARENCVRKGPEEVGGWRAAASDSPGLRL